MAENKSLQGSLLNYIIFLQISNTPKVVRVTLHSSCSISSKLKTVQRNNTAPTQATKLHHYFTQGKQEKSTSNQLLMKIFLKCKIRSFSTQLYFLPTRTNLPAGHWLVAMATFCYSHNTAVPRWLSPTLVQSNRAQLLGSITRCWCTIQAQSTTIITQTPCMDHIPVARRRHYKLKHLHSVPKKKVCKTRK